MEALQQWGFGFIAAFQQIQGPVADGFFNALTFMGAEPFLLPLIPLIFWCLDFRLGARLTFIFLLSTLLNIYLKDWLQQPRPFELDPSVMLQTASGYGFPSNHAQTAAVVWGTIGAWGRRGWLWAAAVILTALIGLSRVYLGVHFPTDVLAGWLLGILVLAVFLAWEKSVTLWLLKRRFGITLAIALVLPVLLTLTHPVDDIISSMGTLAGLGAGLLLTRRYLAFSAGGPWRKRALRYIAGGAVVAGLYLGLRLVFPGEGSPFYQVLRFVRYGALGIWMGYGAPWLFSRLKLSDRS